MNDLSVSLTPIWVGGLLAVATFFYFASGALAWMLACKLTNASRDKNWLTFCGEKAQGRIAELTAQNQALAKALAAKVRTIIDLEMRLRAVDHLLTQGKLAVTQGVDVTGGVGK